MCIVCNAGSSDPACNDALRFLGAWARSGEAMREAADAMLAVSKSMPEKADRKRYDHMHKRMARVIRDWNRLEQEREHQSDTAADKEGED